MIIIMKIDLQNKIFDGKTTDEMSLSELFDAITVVSDKLSRNSKLDIDAILKLQQLSVSAQMGELIHKMEY